MKTLDEMIREIEDWFDDGGVGNILIFRSPHANHVDRVYEETIKLHEMDTPTRALVEQVFELFDSERMEFFRDKQGYPDRVKITRR